MTHTLSIETMHGDPISEGHVPERLGFAVAAAQQHADRLGCALYVVGCGIEPIEILPRMGRAVDEWDVTCTEVTGPFGDEG